MKSLLIVFLLVSSTLFAQEQKITLVEKFSSASCPFCRTSNSSIKPFIENKGDNIVYLVYPYAGGNYIDPMGTFASAYTRARAIDYYGANGFPIVWVNGTRLSTATALLDQDLEPQANPQISINAFASFSSSNVQANIRISSSDNEIYNKSILRMFALLIEKEINYETAPGRNGETNFRWIVRYMFDRVNGEFVSLSPQENELEFNLNQNIDHSVVDPQNLQLVVFIQDIESREVYQAYKTDVEVFINIESEEEKVNIHPNPTKGIINFNNYYSVDVLDINGQIISSDENVKSVYLSEFSSGIYFLRLYDGIEIITNKVILE